VPAKPYQVPNKGQQRVHPQETNFDVDGHIETVSAGPSPRPGTLAWETQQRRSGSERSGSSLRSQGAEDLPAAVEFGLDAEDRLLQASILEVKNKQVQFKLAPTYTLYMSVRHLLSPKSPVTHRAQLVTDFVTKTSKMFQRSIQDHHNDPSSLAFWMANSSELLHMFKQDRDIHPLSGVAQEMLAEAVQAAFHHLVRCLQGDLQRIMPAFLDQSDASDGDDKTGHRYNMGRPTIDDILDTLSAAMTLLRRCRVNAALTIQLFSQLFHFINMWLFNILVSEPQLQLCTRAWGSRLKRRLGRVETWAENQGLELAADCHLCRIIQAAHLLQASKSSPDDITNISSTCFKLNSVQLRCLLTRYLPEPNEPPVSPAFVERVVSIAENMADELARSDEREIRLEEDSDLHLPFLLPEDGYSCDTIRGIPNGLPEFVKQLENSGLCRFVINSAASGSWTVYMGDEHMSDRTGGSPDLALPPTPEIITIAFNKVKGSMGLSIVAAIGEGQPEQGIYIKSVVEGGAAALDGRLQAGDQLLEVDGKSLIGVTQDKAAEMMTKTGQVVKLKVAKRAVLYHNLGSLLSQPSPTSQRAAQTRAPGPNRTFSDEGPPPYNGRDPKAVNGYDRMRAPSSGNLTESRPGGPADPYGYRRDESRSKSTSNLHVETNLDHNDVRPNMKPAQSVGVLHPSQGYGQRPEIRPNDYENQPGYPQAIGQYQEQPVKSHNQYPSQGYQQQQQQQHLKTSDRSSLSSRASTTSAKDPRPTSAYYSPENVAKENQDFSSRPRSEDVGSKLKEWQDKYEDPRVGSRQSPGRQSPPYSNIGAQNREPPPQPTHNPPPKPTAHERLFSQPSIPQKVNINTYNSQPNFYENTIPLQREPPPPFHQLQKPSSERELKPKLAPKPAAAPAKKNWPRVQHVDMQNLKVDNRQSQPNFFGGVRQSPQSGQPSSPHIVQQPQFNHRNSEHDQSSASYDQRSTQKDQRNNQYDQRNPPYDQSSMPHDQRNSQFDQRPHQQSQRNQSQPDLRNDPRFAQDLRVVPDPRNGPAFEYRGFQQDQHNVPDSRNLPQVRDSYPQHHGNNRDGFSQPSAARDAYNQQQNPQKLANNLPLSHEQIRTAQDPYIQQQQQRFVDSSNQYRYSVESLDLPPPPTHKDIPSVVPSPQLDDNSEDLPPLPPPPSHENLVEQKLVEEQLKLMQQINATNQFLATDPRRDRRYSPNIVQQQQLQTQYQPQPQHTPQTQQYHQQQQQQQRLRPQSQPQQPAINRVLPPGVDARGVTPLGYQVIQDGYRPNDPTAYQDYQNISFVSDVRATTGPEPQAPSVAQPSAEYSNSFSNPALRAQGFQVKPSAPVSKAKVRERSDINTRSAWDRDAKEKAQEVEKEELFRILEHEVVDLESRPYLNPQEQERLRKLKMEYEFQRRVKEVSETGEVDNDDDELTERSFNRENVIHSLQEDLEKSRERMRHFELTQQRVDASQEHDRLQVLERRLEAYEKEREEIAKRLQKKQEKRTMGHQEQEQPADFQDRYTENRSVHGSLNNMQNPPGLQPGQGSSDYSQYANVPGQVSVDPSSLAPPPPERKSSYDTFTQHQQRASFRGSNSMDFPAPAQSINNSASGNLPSALKNSQEPPLPAKKSVSFNTDMNTYKERTPNHSVSSYRSPVGSVSIDQGFPPASNYSPDTDVFDPDSHPLHNINSTSLDSKRAEFGYNASSGTPNVIGTQEFYRDPRSRIEAKIASQSATRGMDRMSFRDKMKYFNQDDTIKLKPKASKTLREIESQLNGQ
ncbi:unnamed protein product, partial [Candidula unifasciata]